MTSSDRDRPADQHDHTGHAFARREPTPAPPMRLSDASELVLVASAPRIVRFDRDDLVVRKGQYALRNGHMTPQRVDGRRPARHPRRARRRGHRVPPGARQRRPARHRRRPRRPQGGGSRVRRRVRERAVLRRAIAPTARPTCTPCSSPTVASPHTARPRCCGSTGRASSPSGGSATARETAVQLEFWRFGDDEHRGPASRTRSCAARCRASEAIDDTVRPVRPRLADAREHVRPARERRRLRHRHGVLLGRRLERRVRARAREAHAELRRRRGRRLRGPLPADRRAEVRAAQRCTCSRRGCDASSSRPTRPRRRGSPSIRRSRSCAARSSSPTRRVLPTHNSHAVESQLHHIPGIAEHFLYSNDDMFFGRPLQPVAVLLARRHHEVRRGVDPHRPRRDATRPQRLRERGPREPARCCASASARSPRGTSSTAPRRCARA